MSARDFVACWGDLFDRVTAPSRGTQWLELVGPTLQRQREEQAEEDRQFVTYCAQRDMGFKPEAIRRFFTCANARFFETWYAEARKTA